MSQQLLRLQNLSKYYTSGNSVVVGLNEVSVSFSRGEFVAITGESGSGKSTLAHVLGGILPYESGEMFFMGHPTSHFDSTDYARYRRDHISFISQNYGILPACTVLENVVSALRLTGVKKRTAKKEARRILEEVELWKLRGRRAAKLSSGQKQRLSIARALAKPAPILLADEPTGNLDEANSRKIMELLAHASKDRLVILITHEFSEAQDFATRHITIQNGRIAMDAALQSVPEVEDYTPQPRKKQQHLSPYIARLQLRGRPIWAWLLLLFFTLTAFCVFAFLGTFIIATDDTPTRIYDNSAFRNGTDTRIVAVRSDGAPMSQEDYDKILSGEYVEALEPYGYVTDVNYAYQEGVDYLRENTAVDIGSSDDPNMILSSAVYLSEEAGYLQTVPQLSGEMTFLTAGTLPENHRQVVLAGSADMIGSTFPVYLQDMKHWNRSAMLSFDVEVVGVTDYGTGLYFHEDIGRMFTHAAAYDYENYIYLPADDLLGKVVRTSEHIYGDHKAGYRAYIPAIRGEYTFEDVLEYGSDAVLQLKFLDGTMTATPNGPAIVDPTHDSLLNAYCEVSRKVFEEVTWKYASDQVSITILDYAYTDRALDTLKEQGYVAISPFREGSTKVDPELDLERKQTLGICAAALLAIVVLQITVLRAMFSTQTESYQILSNIGLSCTCARFSILWQILLFTVLGQGFGYGLLMLCNKLGIERIAYVLRYLPPVYMAVLSGVHLAAALIAAVWILRVITRQVFPLAGKTDDLPITEEEAVV